jgi:hypothetical protein
MKSLPFYVILAVSLLALTLTASAREVVLPAGTLLQCTVNEPNFSPATAAVGDPVLCHLRGVVQFGQQAFPRGSYLVGHLAAEKDPGHFVGKGYLQIQFDRIGLPTGDLPLEAKVIATNGYKVDKEGKIDGKGHAKRDVAEWLFPPLWPWKVIMLPARGPRPALKGESVMTLRLMDDVEIPQVAQTYGPGWRFFGRPQSESYRPTQYSTPGDTQAGAFPPQLAVRDASATPQLASAQPQFSLATYATRQPAVGASALPAASGLPGMPVFVLNTGTLLSVSGYGYQDSRITYTLAAGGGGVINADEVDWNATTRLNAQRGVRVTLHMSHVLAGAPGM